MPAVTETLIVLAVCFLPEASPVGRGKSGLVWPIVGGAFGIVALVASVLTATRPVTYSSAMIALGDAAVSQGQFSSAERYYTEAAATDPLAPEPLERLSEVLFRTASSDPRSGDVDFDRGVTIAQLAIQREPRAPYPYARLAAALMVRHRKQPVELHEDTTDLELALELTETAVRIYPTNSRLVAQLATIQSLLRIDESEKTASRAIELDDINRQHGHQDRLLLPEQIDELKRIRDGLGVQNSTTSVTGD